MNLRIETIEPPEENIGENLHDIGLDNKFMDMTSKAQVPKAKIDEQDYIKPKTSAQ